MIHFKPVELADKATIESYTRKSECRNCDMSFANIYCWRHFHQSAWAIVEEFLVIRFLIDGKEQIGYMQPIGEGDFYPILKLLEEDARENFGQRLRLYGLCREGRRCITDSGAHHFAFDDDRALSDYIYLAEDLRNLTGRKYQPKRNHINRFSTQYAHRYEPLGHHHFADCLHLEEKWREARTGTNDSPAMRFEQTALHEAFDHFDELELQGGVLYVEEQLVAFTYGSAINYDTFDCHVEKADTRYDGVFSVINKCFAEQLPPHFTYINREEDMGLEGLRRSKLSYYPTLLWPKTIAVQLYEDELACKALWQQVFGDEESFIDRFLMRHYRQKRLHHIMHEDGMAAMLHRIPMRHNEKRIAYLYAIATAPEQRGRGYASQLISEAIEVSRIEGYDAVALIPANEELRPFYHRFGFSGSYPVTFDNAAEFDFGSGDPKTNRLMLLPLNGQQIDEAEEEWFLCIEPDEE